jgi:cysteine-rich repeat protein
VPLLVSLLWCAVDAEAGRRRASVCGNGVLEAAEECDDGNVLPLDGCSVGCAVEAPSRCAPTSESAYRDAVAGDASFAFLEEYAAVALGFSTRLEEPAACDEGHDPTSFVASLAHTDPTVADAVILSRTDVAGALTTMIAHQPGPHEQVLYTALYAVQLEFRGNGSLRSMTVLDLDGNVLAGSAAASAWTAGLVSCDTRLAEIRSCAAALPLIDPIVELTQAILTCAVQATSSCTGACSACVAAFAGVISMAAGVEAQCGSLPAFSCSTESCELGSCALAVGSPGGRLGITRCNPVEPPFPLCDDTCSQQCIDGECVGFDIVGVSPQPFFMEVCSECCAPAPPSGPELAIELCGSPQFPIGAYAAEDPCPPGWLCGSSSRTFRDPSQDPLLWPAFRSPCWICSNTFLTPQTFSVDLLLTDSRGVSRSVVVDTVCPDPVPASGSDPVLFSEPALSDPEALAPGDGPGSCTERAGAPSGEPAP